MISQRDKGARTGEQWETQTLGVFGDEGCPGASKEVENSRGMSAREVSRVVIVSGEADYE